MCLSLVSQHAGGHHLYVDTGGITMPSVNITCKESTGHRYHDGSEQWVRTVVFVLFVFVVLVSTPPFISEGKQSIVGKLSWESSGCYL